LSDYQFLELIGFPQIGDVSRNDAGSI